MPSKDGLPQGKGLDYSDISFLQRQKRNIDQAFGVLISQKGDAVCAEQPSGQFTTPVMPRLASHLHHFRGKQEKAAW